MNAIADQVVDAPTAEALSADACRSHSLAAWVVLQDQPRIGGFIARLVTSSPTPYVLIGQTLAEVRAQLPPGLVYSERQPTDLPDLVEVWFTPRPPMAHFPTGMIRTSSISSLVINL